MLVDAELAQWARELLREPHEANGKGWDMAALGTHEITAGIGLGLAPPLSPPNELGAQAMATAGAGGLTDLPTPPPAIRPPASAVAPSVTAAAPQAQVAPVAQPTAAPTSPVADLPAMGTPEQGEAAAAVHDYFGADVQASAPEASPEIAPHVPVAADTAEVAEAQPAQLPAIQPAEPVQPVQQAEPVQQVQAAEPVQPVQPAAEPVQLVAVAPAAAEEAAVELPPLVAPAQPEVAPEQTSMIAAEPELEPAAVALQPVEIQSADVAPEAEVAVPAAPEPADVTELVAPLPVLEQTQEPSDLELEELLGAKTGAGFRIVVRLKDADGVEVGEFRDFGTAMEGAQEVIEQVASATESSWPFYAGRFIRPDLIVSVDVIGAERA